MRKTIGSDQKATGQKKKTKSRKKEQQRRPWNSAANEEIEWMDINII